jgi:hypothetical protein
MVRLTLKPCASLRTGIDYVVRNLYALVNLLYTFVPGVNAG